MHDQIVLFWTGSYAASPPICFIWSIIPKCPWVKRFGAFLRLTSCDQGEMSPSLHLPTARSHKRCCGSLYDPLPLPEEGKKSRVIAQPVCMWFRGVGDMEMEECSWVSGFIDASPSQPPPTASLLWAAISPDFHDALLVIDLLQVAQG